MFLLVPTAGDLLVDPEHGHVIVGEEGWLARAHDHNVEETLPRTHATILSPAINNAGKHIVKQAGRQILKQVGTQLCQ